MPTTNQPKTCLYLLNTFSPHELDELKIYVKKLYPRKKQVHQVLENYVQREIPIQPVHPIAENRNNATVIEAITIPKDFKRPLAQLLPLTEEFLRWKKINQEATSFEKKQMMIHIYKERHLDQLFFAAVEQLQQQLSQQPMDRWLSLKKLELYYTKYFTTRFNKIKPTITDISDGLASLDDFFISFKLMYACELQNRHYLLGAANPFKNNWLLEYLLTEKLSKITQQPYHCLYWKVLQLLKEKEDSDANDALFDSACQQYEQLKSQVHPNDLLFVLTLLLNFTARKIRSKKDLYMHKYLHLYQAGLEDGILLADGGLDAHHFINTVAVACHLGQIEWANHFIRKYSVFLNQQEQLPVQQLAAGIIFYKEEQYQKVLDSLIELDKLSHEIDEIFILRAKLLRLKSAVDLNMAQKYIKSQCDSFNVYLRRSNTLGDTILDTYKNFIRVVRMLCLNKSKDQKAIMIFLNNHKTVQQAWLKEKIRNIKE